MTWSFDLALGNTVSVVRAHIGDVDIKSPLMQDETISALYTSNGDDVGKAVIACLRYLQNLCLRPDFKADWLSITGRQEAFDRFSQMISIKEQEFNLTPSGSTTRKSGRMVTMYRGD